MAKYERYLHQCEQHPEDGVMFRIKSGNVIEGPFEPGDIIELLPYVPRSEMAIGRRLVAVKEYIDHGGWIVPDIPEYSQSILDKLKGLL